MKNDISYYSEIMFYVYDMDTSSAPEVFLTEKEMLECVEGFITDGANIDDILVVKGQQVKVKLNVVVVNNDQEN